MKTFFRTALLALLPISRLAGNFDEAIFNFDSGYYEKSIPAFLDLSANGDPQAKEYLAYSYFLAHKYQDAIDTLSQIPKNPSSLLLKGMAQYKLNRLADAKNSLTESLGIMDSAIAGFTLANVLMELNEQEQAITLLEKLTKNKDASISSLAKISLSKLFLKNKETAKALEIALEAYKSSQGEVRYEAAFYAGESYYVMEEYEKAAEFFELSFPKKNHKEAPWIARSLYKQGTSYLKLAETPGLSKSEALAYYDKSENIFFTLSEELGSEHSYLALCQCYFSKAKKMEDSAIFDQAIQKAGFKPNKPDSFSTAILNEKVDEEEAKKNGNEMYPGVLWHFKGVIELQQAYALKGNGSSPDLKKKALQAIHSLNKALSLLKDRNKLAALTMKHLAEAYFLLESHEYQLLALETLTDILENSGLIGSLADKDEIAYLKAWILTGMAEKDSKYLTETYENLSRLLAQYPQGKYRDEASFLLGYLYFQNKEFEKAEKVYSLLAAQYPHSKLAPEALYRASQCCRNNPDKAKEYKQEVFTKYPDSDIADEAYFFYYTFREYLQGDRTAIRHLAEMANRYPGSPYLIYAYHLLGLDSKRDRKSPEDKWIQRKNLLRAIEYFRLAESRYDKLNETGRLNNSSEYLNLKYKAMLERALANFQVAVESQAAKKTIYLDYAEELFRVLIAEFEKDGGTLCKEISKDSTYCPLEEESSYELGTVLLLQGKTEEAEALYVKMLEKYNKLKITKGYYLSRALFQLGNIAMEEKQFPLAAEYFSRSEGASKGKLLTTEQKLDLLIRKSEAYKQMQDYDKAMIILSQIINENVVSGLRLKAMFLRAEIYELQGRKELAYKQLKATANKGGEWAKRAREKLEAEYGFE